MMGWHFVNKARRLGYGDGRKVKVGETLSYSNPYSLPPVACYRGMHASRRIVDALSEGKGQVLCRVELTGDLDEHLSEKASGRHRKVLWMKHLSKEVFVDIVRTHVPRRILMRDCIRLHKGMSLDSLICHFRCLPAKHHKKVNTELVRWAKMHGCP